MKAILVLAVGLVFGLMTPDLGEAHKGKQNDRGSGYSQQYDDHRGHDGWRQHDKHKQKHQVWKKHRKGHRHDARHWHRHQHRPTRVIYRDRWPYPLFPGIVIHLPL